MHLPIAFSGNPLDRDDRLRIQPDILSRAQAGRMMVFLGDRVITDATGQPLWFQWSDLPATDGCEHIFLGQDKTQDTPSAELCFALRVRADHPAYMAYLEGLAHQEIKARDLRGLAMKMGPDAQFLGMMAQAKSLLDWHENHRYCARCGARTQMVKGGYQRDCSACGAEHYPRTDPVVITLVIHGTGADAKALVGRGPKMPPGFFSALAGFVEPGETLEEAVHREIHEEAGLSVRDINYVASQPWPWPSSLMIGCIAHSDSMDAEPDMDEIDDLRWLSRAEINAAMAGQTPDMAVPPAMAIAHQLLRYFLHMPDI